MSNSRSFTEVPRFLLPRLTWLKASSRTPLAPFPGLPQQTIVSRPRRGSDIQISSSRQVHTKSRRQSVSAIQSSPGRPSDSPSRHVLSHSTHAIRHNGVYVAAFKAGKRAFHATAARQKDHHFDTLKFVTRLRDEGFSEDQAVAMMRVLNDVIEESIQNLTRTMVLKEGTGSYADTYNGDSRLTRTYRFRKINIHPES